MTQTSTATQTPAETVARLQACTSTDQATAIVAPIRGRALKALAEELGVSSRGRVDAVQRSIVGAVRYRLSVAAILNSLTARPIPMAA